MWSGRRIYNNYEDKIEILAEIIREYMHGYVEIGARLRVNARPDQSVFGLLQEMVHEAIDWRIRNADLRPLIDLAKHQARSG